MKEGGLRLSPNYNPSEIEAPLVSIITVVFNGAHSIEATMRSVLGSDRKNFEYIIVDGGSNDGTVNVLRKYNHEIDYWISEPDKGIYDAINKAIQLSHGYFFYVLNIGDTLIELPVKELRSAKQEHADVVLFDVSFSNGKTFSSQIDYRTRFGNTIHHQGAFYRRDLDVRYNVAYKVFADFDVNQKLYVRKKKFVKFNKIISYHSLDGISNERKYRREYFSVIRENFGLFWVIIGFLYIWQGETRIKLKKLIGACF